MNLLFTRQNSADKTCETLTQEDVLYQLLEALLDGQTIHAVYRDYWVDDAGD